MSESVMYPDVVFFPRSWKKHQCLEWMRARSFNEFALTSGRWFGSFWCDNKIMYC